MNTKFFDIAKQLAQLSDHKQHKMGVVITRGNKIVSKGYNKVKTHPKSANFCKTIHAEFDAVMKARSDLEGSVIYIYRERKNGDLGMARPCEFCQKLLMSEGITTWCYSTEGGYKKEDAS